MAEAVVGIEVAVAVALVEVVVGGSTLQEVSVLSGVVEQLGAFEAAERQVNTLSWAS